MVRVFVHIFYKGSDVKYSVYTLADHSVVN